MGLRSAVPSGMVGFISVDLVASCLNKESVLVVLIIIQEYVLSEFK
jgi:uncharacterized membrane protein YuzA (DUF378 family)